MKFAKIAAIGLVMLLTGCASGVKYNDMKESITAIQPGQGRIYFMRSGSMMGAALQPNINLDSKPIGVSKPGGFFYVDAAPGSHDVATSTEVTNHLTFVLAPGETKYVKTSVGFGLVVGHIVPELINADEAKEMLPDLSYLTGDQNKPAPQQ
jgi:hypothetical protein